ncbi:MAG: HAD family phosphatase [Pseudomonadota bacterium]
MTFRALLFDMDGLLLDTERMSLTACQQTLQEFGVTETMNSLTRYVGRPQRQVAADVAQRTGAQIDVEAYHDAWLARYETALRGGIDLRPTVRRSLRHVAELGLPCAVVTTTERTRASAKLQSVGLAAHFSTIVGGTCVRDRKPQPAPYLLAAEKLGVDPAECAAFEDSDTGVRSAIAAGMTVAQVPDLVQPPQGRAHIKADTLWQGLQMLGLAPCDQVLP